MNKGLETFQLLLLERRGDNRRVAATVMDPQVASLGTRVSVRELVTLLQLTATPSSSTLSIPTPSSDFIRAMSAVSSFTSSSSSSAVPSSLSSPSSSSSSSSSSNQAAAIKTKASFAKGGRAAAQTVFPLVDNTPTSATTSATPTSSFSASSSSSSSSHTSASSSASASSSHPSPRPPPRSALKLVGSVHRRDVFLYLQTLFAQADQRTQTQELGLGLGLSAESGQGLGEGLGQSYGSSGRLSLALRSMLPEDASEEEDRARRADR